jgi:hypothetical protein
MLPYPAVLDGERALTDGRVVSHMCIPVERVPELVSPPVHIFDESLMRQKSDVVGIHESFRFEAEMIVSLAENDEESDLRKYPPIRRGALGSIKKDVVIFDGLQLCRDRRASVSDTEMMVQHVK